MDREDRGERAESEQDVTLACVVARSQALVRQLEAELQKERALTAARLERLAAENRLLSGRLRERQVARATADAPLPPRAPGRVSPFRRGQRGL